MLSNPTSPSNPITPTDIMTDVKQYDHCIIGGGISGLYCAKRLKELSPETKCVVIEKEDRFGGRLQVSKLNGLDIVEGAGIGRMSKDKRLLALVKEMGIDTSSYDSVIDYASTLDPKRIKTRSQGVKEIKRLLSELRSFTRSKIFTLDMRHKYNFEMLARRVLGNERYERFVNLCGFTDYKHADVIDTLFNYGFDDNYSDAGLKDTIVKIPWTKLIAALVKENRGKNVVLKKGCLVTSVETSHSKMKDKNRTKKNDQKIFRITFHDYSTHEDTVIESSKLIIATTIEPLLHLLPRSCMNDSIQGQMASQPFIRVYAHIDKKKSKEFIEKIETVTIVPNILQKIIPMSKERGVYMIAYSDNENAVRVYESLSEKNMEAYIRDALGIDEISIIKMKSFYWREGTHYFRPLSPQFKNRQAFLNQTLCPCDDKSVYLLGEGFSNNQGWTEGALERVDKMFEMSVDL